MPAADSARLKALLQDGVPYRVALAIRNTPVFDIETGKILAEYLPESSGGSSGNGLPGTVRARTSAYTALVGDLVLADPTSAPFTVTLPAAPAVGALVTVRKVDASVNAVTVAPAGGGTIDGDANATIITRWYGAVFEHVGSNAWHIVSLAAAAPAGANGADGLDAAAVLELTSYEIKNRSVDYSAQPLDYVCYDISSGSHTLTLPAAPADQTRVGAKVIGISGAYTLTIAASGVDDIDIPGGASSFTLTSLYESVELQYNAALDVWVRIAGYIPPVPTQAILVAGSPTSPIASSSAARPNAVIVYWYCANSVVPTYAIDGDLVFNLDA